VGREDEEEEEEEEEELVGSDPTREEKEKKGSSEGREKDVFFERGQNPNSTGVRTSSEGVEEEEEEDSEDEGWGDVFLGLLDDDDVELDELIC